MIQMLSYHINTTDSFILIISTFRTTKNISLHALSTIRLFNFTNICISMHVHTVFAYSHDETLFLCMTLCLWTQAKLWCDSIQELEFSTFWHDNKRMHKNRFFNVVYLPTERLFVFMVTLFTIKYKITVLSSTKKELIKKWDMMNVERNNSTIIRL